MHLSNEEKETIITFDESSATAIIFTYSRRWQTHLEKKLGIIPAFDNGYGGKEYHIAKSRIPLPRVPRKLSPEQREKAAQRLREMHRQKSPNPSGNNTAIKKSQAETFSEGKTIAQQKKTGKLL